jgi:hypothetical protein
MICFKCDCGKEAAFFTEKFPCKCGEEVVFEYNFCESCGWMWRSVNGEPSEESMIYSDDFIDLGMPPKDLGEEEAKIVKNMEGEIDKIDKIARGEAAMADYVLRCLRCGAVAHEKGQGRYGCGECDFEWEVIKFD